jgi:hypothetical protein
MDAHAITMKGPFYAEYKSISVYNTVDNGKLRYNSNKLYFGRVGWKELAVKYHAVPSGTILLFDSNTTITGFTVLTRSPSSEDELVYAQITGTNGGGGATRTGSMWEQPTHMHDQSQHIHSISHYHTFSGKQTGLSPAAIYDTDGSNEVFGYVQHRHNVSGNTDPATGNVVINSSITTSTDIEPRNTWRPRGRNFTKQQRI